MGLLLMCAACSGSKGTIDDAGPTTVDPVFEEVRIAAYEDFDPTPYSEPSSIPVSDISHDVPDLLMENQASRGAVRVDQGYRIQIFSSLDKREALSVGEAAKAWWRTLNQEERAKIQQENALAVYVPFRQPYYRVRLGNFVTREEAEDVLSLIRRRFSGAFIAPDRVAVMR